MSNTVEFGMKDILSILPHRPPFLFVDKVVKLVPSKMIITERELHADEPHFAGHFPKKAIMPGVLITDALAQTSGLLWGLSKRIADSAPEKEPEIFFLASVNMKYTHPAVPGDVLRMTVHADKSFGNLHTYVVEAMAGRQLITKGTLTLAMKDVLL